MKKFIALVLIGLGGVGALASWLGLVSGEAMPNNRLEIWYTKKYSLADLNQIKEDLLAYGIKLQYHRLNFSQNGDLEFMEFSVDSTVLGKLIAERATVNFKEIENFGFLFDWQSGSPQSFYIGPKPY